MGSSAIGSRRSRGNVVVAVVLAVAGAGCGGPGAHGHAPEYVPLPEERTAAESARPFDPVMAERDPESFKKSPVSVFGVVTGRSPGPGGAAALVLSVRRLEPRNLCQNARDDDTCRVTVTDRDFGVIRALVSLRPEDDTGERSVGIGSLVRVIGALGDDVGAAGGNQVVRATYYRHWPRHSFVTRASADTMRQ